MNYQVDVLAECIAQVWGNEEVGSLDKSEAADIVKMLNAAGYGITKIATTSEHVSDGPIQRALGMSEGDG